MLTMDQMVPEDQLVRKLEAAIDFNFIYSFVASQVSKILSVFKTFFFERSRILSEKDVLRYFDKLRSLSVTAATAS